MTDTSQPRPGGEVVVYEAPDGEIQLNVRFDQDTVWLTQRQMAEIFVTSSENVIMHLRNVFAQNELDERETTKDFLVVRTEGARQVRRSLRHYNLDAIISVGYRVNSKRAVRFRQWATRTLREHLVRGYTLNEHRLAPAARRSKGFSATSSRPCSESHSTAPARRRPRICSTSW